VWRALSEADPQLRSWVEERYHRPRTPRVQLLTEAPKRALTHCWLECGRTARLGDDLRTSAMDHARRGTILRKWSKRIEWSCSSEPSGFSSTTSNASSSCARPLSHDALQLQTSFC
jgi:hypothetical protein